MKTNILCGCCVVVLPSVHYCVCGTMFIVINLQYTFVQLLEVVQASEEELLEALKKLHVCNIDGKCSSHPN